MPAVVQLCRNGIFSVVPLKQCFCKFRAPFSMKLSPLAVWPFPLFLFGLCSEVDAQFRSLADTNGLRRNRTHWSNALCLKPPSGFKGGVLRGDRAADKSVVLSPSWLISWSPFLTYVDSNGSNRISVTDSSNSVSWWICVRRGAFFWELLAHLLWP